MAKKLGPNAQKLKNLDTFISKQQSAAASQNSTANMQNSINNYKTRLNAAGVNPEQATDKRNWFEKLFNLPEGQNALFDVFEIIGRPQQALFGAIQGLQEGENPLDYAVQGLQGKETFNGGDILRNMGVSDKKLFTNPLSGEDTSLADILGFGADVILDPVDLVPAGGLIKAGKLSSAASDVKKATKALDAANVLGDAAKIADATKALDIAKAAQDTVKATKYSGSLLEAGMQGLTGGTKRLAGSALTKGAEIADVNTIGKLAKANNLIDNGTKVTKEMIPELTKSLSDIGINVSSKTDALNSAKKFFSKTADYGASFEDDLFNKIMQSDNALDMTNAFGKRIANDTKKAAEDYAKKMGVNADDVLSNTQKLITSKYKVETSVADKVVDFMKGNKSIIEGDRKALEDLQKSIGKFKKVNNITDNVLDTEIRGSKLVLKGDKKLLGDLVGTKDLMNQLSDIKVVKNTVLDKEFQKELKGIQKLYDNDSAFRSIVDNAESNYTKFNDAIKKVTGETIDFSDMLREGYATNALTPEGKKMLQELKNNNIDLSQKTMNARKHQYGEDILEGNKKVVEGRKYSAYAEQANKEFSEDLQKGIKARNNKIDYLESQRHETKLKDVKTKLKENSISQEEAFNNFKENMSKLNINKDKAIELEKSYNRKIDDISDIINDKVMKNAEKINDTKLIDKMTKSTDNYVRKSNKVTEIQAELSKSGLSDAKVKSLSSKLEKAITSQNNAKAELKAVVAKIQGGASENYIKKAGKLANDVADDASALTKKAIKQQEKVKNSLSKIQQYKESYSSIANQLKTQQADLQLQLKKLEGMSKEAIAKSDENITKQIANLQKDIDLLSSFEGQKLFSTNFYEGFEDFVNKTTNQSKAMLNYNEVLLHSGLSNQNVLKFIEKGSNVNSVNGMVRLDTSKATSYLEGMKNFMPENSSLIKEFTERIKGSKNVFIDKDVNHLITLSNRATESEAKILLDTIDKTNNTFKKLSTFTPGFHLRNVTGNVSNMWLSGMSAKDVATSYARATKLSKSDYIIDLVTKNANNTLTKAEAKDFKIVKQFIESGALGNSKDIRDLGELVEKAAKSKDSKNILKKAWDGAFTVSAKANEKMDNLSRMALLTHASENSKYVTKLGAKNPIDAMHKVLFDPQNMSPFEKKYIKRAIPFYTFTKQNLMFQMKNVTQNTSRYNRLIKTYNKMYDAVGEGNYRQYQKENFEIPLKAVDGGTIGLKANLPAGDLGEYMSNPLQRLVSSATPLAKAPVEKVTGKDLFTGQDISDQSTFDTLVKSLGLSNAQKFINGIGDVTSSESENPLASLLPSVIRYTDTEKIANQEQYQELMEYQQLVKELKNQGIDVPTIKELTNSTNRSINAINKRRNNQKRR